MVEVLVLDSGDWRLWRRLRRRALEESPDAFGSTLAEWSGTGDTEQRWRRRLDEVALNLVLQRDGVPVAMVSATRPGTDGAVELISLWVSPGARGQGLGDEAIGAVAAWARVEYPGAALVLSVREDNEPARRLYERNGFRDAGPSPDDPAERLLRRPYS